MIEYMKVHGPFDSQKRGSKGVWFNLWSLEVMVMKVISIKKMKHYAQVGNHNSVSCIGYS